MFKSFPKFALLEIVFGIGMTSCLERLDQLKELDDAYVPFLFDVHGMIFSEDTPALENALHKAFSDSVKLMGVKGFLELSSMK